MAGLDWVNEEYIGRPSVSPVVATLVATGVIPKGRRILDVGCGRGTDAIELARLGCRHVDGIDVNANAIRLAKARAKRAGLSKRLHFTRGDALELEAIYGRAAFATAIDTLFVNNLTDDEARAYLAQLARVVKPGGLVVLQSKVWPREMNTIEDGLPRAALRPFREDARFATHLAERGGRAVPVVVRLLRRRG